MTEPRHAYQAARALDHEQKNETGIQHEHVQAWHNVSQSIYHPHHAHQHAHHHLNHIQHAAQPAGEHSAQTRIVEKPNQQTNVIEKPNPLTPAQMRERQQSSADDQQWDETTGGVRRDIRSAYDATTGAVRGTFTNIHSTWDRFTDGCTQLTSWFPGDNTRRHAEELNIQAGTEIKTGHIQLADKLLSRDLQFSVSSFGLNDKLTVELSAELRKLHKEHKDLPRLQIMNEA